MCELAVVAAPADVAFSQLHGWALRMEQLGVTGFGWGVAWLQHGEVHRYRRPVPLADDDVASEALRDVRSSRFLIHFRRPSQLLTTGTPDTQPFLAKDRSFAFGHNGFFVDHEQHRAQLLPRLHGTADSEIGFRLLEDFAATGSPPAGKLQRVHEVLGGEANFACLSVSGALDVYASCTLNPMWKFRTGELTLATTSLNSADDAIFQMIFTDAQDKTLLSGRASVAPPVTGSA